MINVESELAHCEGAKRRQTDQVKSEKAHSKGEIASKATTSDVSDPETTASVAVVNMNATLADDVFSIAQFDERVRECISTRLSTDPDEAVVILTGLHACGDLTPTMLKVFAEKRGSSRQGEESRRLTFDAIAVVGCCYHRMSPIDEQNGETSRRLFTQFPLSTTLLNVFDDGNASPETTGIENSLSAANDNPLSLLGSYALRLAAQETMARWRRQTGADHDLHTRHVAYRAVLEAALSRMKLNCEDHENGIDGIEKMHKKLVAGKKASFVDFDAYKASLLDRIKIKDSSSVKIANEVHNESCSSSTDHNRVEAWIESFKSVLNECHDDFQSDFSFVEPTTFLQYCLQGVLETLILTDRVAFLREMGVYDCEAVPLFDDELSPRNVALVATRNSLS